MKEEGKEEYYFLFDSESTEGQYYRWRTFGEYISSEKYGLCSIVVSLYEHIFNQFFYHYISYN